MILKLGNRDYEIRFGIAALKFLDEVYKIEVQGVGFGYGLQSLITSLQMLNVLAIVNFIKAGTATEAQKPKDLDIENFIGNLTDEEFDNIFKEALEEIKKQPLTRATMKKFL